MLNQRELAGLLGITKEHLSGIKNGRKNASAKLAKKIAKRTGTDPATWIFGSADDRRKAIDGLRG